MKRILTTLIAIYGIIYGAIQVSGARATDLRNNRHNQFDPLYSYDDIDSHTVSASSSSNKPAAAEDFKQQQRVFTRQQQADPINPILNSQLGRPDFLSGGQLKTTELNSAAAPTFSLAASANANNNEEPQHWSALENYYKKLRQQSVAAPKTQVQQQQASNQQQLPIYQVLQQEVDDQLVNGYKPLQGWSKVQPSSSPSLLLPGVFQTSGRNPAFQLPMVADRTAPPLIEPDFAADYASVHQNSAPGISRLESGASIGSDRMIIDENGRIVAQDGVNIKRPASAASARPVLASYDKGKVKYLEWRKLPELLAIQQQQQRVKHQQETFGSPWYDHQQSRDLFQEEAFCGPRNFVNFHVVPAATNQRSVDPSSGLPLLQTEYNPVQLSRIQFQLDPNSAISANQVDVAVTLSAGEYPSHVGVYNGSQPSDENFLCAATLVNERFALTLASCVGGANDSKKLSVRAGEWNLNKTGGSTTNERPMIVREVEQIYIFPRYKNDSREHNLALIKLSKPLEYLEMAYVCPACQTQSRASIRTSSCWAPVRNTTLTEYFDAEGEGETKERKSVSMVELPVRLIANDDAECYRQTKVDFFNFQHPNYICSADYRTANWRARLNQTEYFGSGIYCNEGGNLSLISILHPIFPNSSSAHGFMDLSYYRPWMRNVISGRSF